MGSKRRGGPFKLPNGKWAVRWRELRAGPTGKRKHCQKSFTSHRAAETHWREVQDAHAAGREWVGRSVGERVPTINEVAAAYLAVIKLQRSASTHTVYRSWLNTFGRWATARLGGVGFVDSLERALLDDFHAYCLEERGVEMQSANDMASLIYRMWDWAWDREEYDGYVPRPRKPTLGRVLPKQPHPAPLWSEMDACIAHADGAAYYAGIIMRATGLRCFKQAVKLEWRDLSLDTARLEVRPALGKSAQEQAGRNVPVPEWFVREVSGWPGARQGRLVPRLNRSNLSDRFVQAWEMSGVRCEVWGPARGRKGQPTAAFRHGYQTGLRAAGVQLDTIKALVGHSRGLSGVYIDADQALRMEAAVALVPPIGKSNLRRLVRRES